MWNWLPAPAFSTVSHFFLTTSYLAWTNTIQVKCANNDDVPCHAFQLNPVISKSEMEILWLYVLVWPAQENVYFEICLSQNCWMFLTVIHTWTMLNWRYRVTTSSHNRDRPFAPCSQFGFCFKDGIKAISRSEETINRVLGFSQFIMFMFLGCIATVVGNYRRVGEDGYWWTVPPPSFLFAQAQHWGCLNSQSHHKVPHV